MTTAPNQQSIHRWRSDNNSFYEFIPPSLFLFLAHTHSFTRVFFHTHIFLLTGCFLAQLYTLYIFFFFGGKVSFTHYPPLSHSFLRLIRLICQFIYKTLQIICERFLMACIHGLGVAKLLPLSIFFDYRYYINVS